MIWKNIYWLAHQLEKKKYLKYLKLTQIIILPRFWFRNTRHNSTFMLFQEDLLHDYRKLSYLNQRQKLMNLKVMHLLHSVCPEVKQVLALLKYGNNFEKQV